MVALAIPPAILFAEKIAQLLQTVEWLYPPLGEFKGQTAFKSWPNRLPTIDQLASLRRKGLLDENTYFDNAERLGYDRNYSKHFYGLTEQPLSVGDYIALYRREKLSYAQLTSKLLTLGLTQEDITNALSATEYFPPPSDLVSFAVRDAYSQDIVNRFQLLEGLPQRFLDEAKKSGMPTDMAKLYWSAHWRLPSATQGFEMFHRGLIAQDDLNSLLQALDYSPFWRDKLTKLSYRTLTRVDVRRMYKLGVLDEEKVAKSYRDIGYSPEDADAMTAFTVKYEQSEGEGLTRESVLSAFRNDYITELEAVEYLQLLGMGKDVIQFYINLTNSQKDMADLTELADYLRQNYLSGNITMEQAVQEFISNGAPQALIQSFQMKLRTRALQRVKNVPKNDLDNWLKLGIIDESDYSSKMTALGYSENDIVLYMQEYTIENPDGAVKKVPIGTLVRWLKKGIIKEALFRQRAKQMGYSDLDISNFSMEVSSNAQGNKT